MRAPSRETPGERRARMDAVHGMTAAPSEDARAVGPPVHGREHAAPDPREPGRGCVGAALEAGDADADADAWARNRNASRGGARHPSGRDSGDERRTRGPPGGAAGRDWFIRGQGKPAVSPVTPPSLSPAAGLLSGGVKRLQKVIPRHPPRGQRPPRRQSGSNGTQHGLARGRSGSTPSGDARQSGSTQWVDPLPSAQRAIDPVGRPTPFSKTGGSTHGSIDPRCTRDRPPSRSTHAARAPGRP